MSVEMVLRAANIVVLVFIKTCEQRGIKRKLLPIRTFFFHCGVLVFLEI